VKQFTRLGKRWQADTAYESDISAVNGIALSVLGWFFHSRDSEIHIDIKGHLCGPGMALCSLSTLNKTTIVGRPSTTRKQGSDDRAPDTLHYRNQGVDVRPFMSGRRHFWMIRNWRIASIP
jgi:hypothetical protein